ncbi:MAG: hemolysin III family protein [Propionibacteriales bacterium]|nr:hemolysin III family protein [Propionibacteriales bacterium]
MIAQTTQLLKEAAREIKPHLRGWLHLGILPLSLAAGIVLVSLAPDTQARLASGVFALSSSMLFASSALFHRGHWDPRWHSVLRRIDHSNIFLLIAGTYTPFAVILLDGADAKILLSLVWGGALIGIAFRIFWLGAPRWLYLPVYVALGWAAIFWLNEFAAAGGPVVLSLIIVGGGLYSIGGVVYGLKRPNPIPRWFGFHEVFHSFTIAAFIVHYVGISIIVYGRR